jgi:hypothetical protein
MAAGAPFLQVYGELAIELAERTAFVVDPTNLNQVILAEGQEKWEQKIKLN